MHSTCIILLRVVAGIIRVVIIYCIILIVRASTSSRVVYIYIILYYDS